jgi:hypothetical protein
MHSHNCQLTHKQSASSHLTAASISSNIIQHHVLLQLQLIMASQCISSFMESQRPTIPSNMFTWGILLCKIRVSLFISKQPQSWTPMSLKHCLQSALQFGLITISKFTQCEYPCTSLNSLDYSLQLYMLMAGLCIITLSQPWPPVSHNYELQVHLHLHMITASMCIPDIPGF